jgi:hypothetical protein
MTKTYDINIRVKVKGFDAMELQAAKYIASRIRDKIRKAMDEDSYVIQWCIDAPKESESEIN